MASLHRIKVIKDEILDITDVLCRRINEYQNKLTEHLIEGINTCF